MLETEVINVQTPKINATYPGLPSISAPQSITGGNGSVAGSVEAPSASLLQRLARSITIRSLVRFTIIYCICGLLLIGIPPVFAAILVFMGLIAMLQSGEWPNDPIFSCGSEGQ